jgi:TetR/AcrR family transcriptional repressor of nem operon
MQQSVIRSDWTAESLALHTQVVLQAAFILAKANERAGIASAGIDHLRRYIELVFQAAMRREKKS